jgi:hypothetical protein
VREIGLPAATLIEAVRVVGPMVADVREHLKTRSLYARPR